MDMWSLSLALIRIGAILVGLALLSSLWASPNRLLSLPWLVIAMVGMAAVLVITSRLRPAISIRPWDSPTTSPKHTISSWTRPSPSEFPDSWDFLFYLPASSCLLYGDSHRTISRVSSRWVFLRPPLFTWSSDSPTR